MRAAHYNEVVQDLTRHPAVLQLAGELPPQWCFNTLGEAMSAANDRYATLCNERGLEDNGRRHIGGVLEAVFLLRPDVTVQEVGDQ